MTFSHVETTLAFCNLAAIASIPPVIEWSCYRVRVRSTVRRVLGLGAAVLLTTSLHAGDLDTIGVTLLRQFDPTLQGAGVNVAQVEAPENGTNVPPAFEVDFSAVGQPASLFTYSSSLGTAAAYPNGIGSHSGHADAVGGNFYAPTSGAAPQVNHVDNYEVVHFLSDLIEYPGTAIQARVANQSFIFDPSAEDLVNTNYDDFAARYRTLFVSGMFGVNAVPPLCPPGTCYNGIGVATYGGFYIPGPTADGRCKPDLVSPDAAHAPNSAVSYATAYASGCAAILVQAGSRGDGGSGTSAAATDVLAVKALLLNGAVKPSGWTNGPTTPLDARYGAGIVNVFNSWHQLKGGQHSYIETSAVSSGSPHPPGPSAANEPSLVGWITNRITTASSSQDKIHHYYFNLPAGAPWTLTATLVWNRLRGKTAINDLDLFLYDTSNSNIVASSVSAVDNVEHLSLPRLAPGRYDLQVLMNGNGQVTSADAYGLAFEFFNLNLDIAVAGPNIVLSWPAAPTGFRLMSVASLNPPVAWTPVSAAVSVNTNTSQNVVSLPIAGASQYFRLQRP